MNIELNEKELRLKQLMQDKAALETKIKEHDENTLIKTKALQDRVEEKQMSIVSLTQKLEMLESNSDKW